jgi:hypothetical protein
MWGTRMAHRRSLPSATPDFLLISVALANFMPLSLQKAAHAVVSSAAWQEIRVRFGRDDKQERVVDGRGPLSTDKAVADGRGVPRPNNCPIL